MRTTGHGGDRSRCYRARDACVIKFIQGGWRCQPEKRHNSEKRSEIVELMSVLRQERERERRSAVAQLVREGRWHAVCNTDVMQRLTRPQKSRATTPPLYAFLRASTSTRLSTFGCRSALKEILHFIQGGQESPDAISEIERIGERE